MKARMTHAARVELANAIRARYSAACGKAKRRILNGFIAASGYHEKSAIRVATHQRGRSDILPSLDRGLTGRTSNISREASGNKIT